MVKPPWSQLRGGEGGGGRREGVGGSLGSRAFHSMWLWSCEAVKQTRTSIAIHIIAM